MKHRKWMLVTSMSAMLVGSALARADTGTDNQGNVYNFASKDSGLSTGATPTDTTDETGRFMSREAIHQRGGVGNYLTRDEAKAYNEKVAEEQRLKNQAAGMKAEAKGPDEGVVFFDFGKSELSKDDQKQISSMAGELKKDPSLIVEVNGYTDSVGGNQLNQNLSEHRADSVKHALISNGVKPEQITTYAYGKDEPIATNDTSAGRSVNRRAELYIETVTG